MFERPTHTFVGYFIGSPGMNVMPVAIEGRKARVGSQTIELPGGLKSATAGTTELGIRPEFVQLGESGMPMTITKIEDIGRLKIVRASLEGRDIAAIVPEDGTIPADPHVRFDPKGISIYADSRRVEMGA